MLKNRFDVLLFAVAVSFAFQLPAANAQVRRVFQSPQPVYQPQTFPQQTFPQQTFPQQTFPQQQVQQFPQGIPVQPQTVTPAVQPPARTQQSSQYDGDIRDQLNKTRAKLGRYSSQLRLLIKNNDELKARNKKLETAVIKRNKIIESKTDSTDDVAGLAKQEIARLKQVIEANETQKKRLEDSYKAQDEAVNELKNSNVKLKQQAALAQEQNKALENLKQQLTRTQSDGAAMSLRLQEAQQKLANMANPAPDTAADDLKRQLEMASKENESLAAELKQTRDMAAAKQKQARDMLSMENDSTMELKQALELASKKNESLAMQLNEARESKLDMSSLETSDDAPNLVDGTMMQEKIEQLEKANSDMRQQYQAAMKQEADLKSRVETLGLENKQAQDRMRDLAGQLADAKSRVAPPASNAMSGDFQPRVAPAVAANLNAVAPAPSPAKRVAPKRVRRVEKSVAQAPVVAPVAIDSAPVDVDEVDSRVADVAPVAEPTAVTAVSAVSAASGSWLSGPGNAKYWALGLMLIGLAIGLSVAYAESLEGRDPAQVK